ncbi:MAG: LysR family transcriptional regulator [Bradyrhizobium sp.]|jgi:DNA-binding transcriptional LysR family regulator
MAYRVKIDPRRLLCLLSVAKHGSFSAAAAAMNMSQPALSRSIALLEHEVGVAVLERGRHGARLNAMGRVLVFHAEALDALLERTREDVRLRSLGLEGSVRIGVTPITAAGIVPKAMEVLLQMAPKIHVSITEGLDSEIADLLRRGQLDLVVSRMGPEDPDLNQEPLFMADWALITRIGHPVSRQTSVKLSDLKDVSWVLPAGGSAFRQQMEQLFAAFDLGWPTQSINTNSILSIKAIVMNTDYVSLMARGLVEVEIEAGRLQATTLDGVGSQRPVGLMWRRNETPAPTAARLAEILRSVAKQEAPPRTAAVKRKRAKPARRGRSNR